MIVMMPSEEFNLDMLSLSNAAGRKEELNERAKLLLVKKKNSPKESSKKDLTIAPSSLSFSIDGLELEPRALKNKDSKQQGRPSLNRSMPSFEEETPSTETGKKQTSFRRGGGLMRLFSSSRRLVVEDDAKPKSPVKSKSRGNSRPGVTRAESLRLIVGEESGGKGPSRRRLVRRASAKHMSGILNVPDTDNRSSSTKSTHRQVGNRRMSIDERLDSLMDHELDKDQMGRRGSITTYNLDESLHRVQAKVNASLGLLPPPPPAKGSYSPRYFPSPIESRRFSNISSPPVQV